MGTSVGWSVRWSAAMLLGARVRIGSLQRGRIVDVLLDQTESPILVRIVLLPDGEEAYLAVPVLEAPVAGVVAVAGQHVLLDAAQARYYERRAAGWLSERHVTADPIQGIVAA